MRELRHEELAKLHMMAAKKMKDTLRTVIYARKSREDETKTSLSTQIDECKELIGNNQLLSFDENDIFQEDNVSGMYMDNRKELLKLLDLIKSNKVDVIVVMKSDRLSRSVENMENILKLFENHNTLLIAGDDLGDDSAAGILIRQIMYATSEFHVRRTAEDVMKVHTKLVKDAKTVGMSNYGYMNVDRKYVQNPEEAIAVSLVFDLFLEGKSYRQIANELEHRGFKPRKSRLFSNSSINGILTNKRNCGISVWNRIENQHSGSKIIKQYFDEVTSTEVVLEPIISKDKFDLVQEMLEGRAKAHVNKTGKIYGLTGVIKCNSCGGSMTGAKRIGGRTKIHYHNYECRNHSKRMGSVCSTKPIRADYLEEHLKNQITIIINESIKFEPKDDVLGLKLKDIDSRIKRLNRELTSHQTKLDKLVFTYSESTNPNIKESSERQIDNLSKLIKVTQDLINQQESSKALFDKAKSKLIGKNLSVDDIFTNDITTRHIFQLFIINIKVDNNNIEVEYL